jgi:integrase
MRVERGRLFIDFRWRGVRCREWTGRPDTPEDRAAGRRSVREIDGEIAAGRFDYARHFPHGPKLAMFTTPPADGGPPPFREYVRRWLADKGARVAAGTAYDWGRIVEARLIPAFGEKPVSEISVEAVEGFVAALKRGEVLAPPAPEGADKRRRPRKPGKVSNRRVNIILQVLRQSLERAVKRGWLADNPARAVDRLREDKAEIAPLSFDEVRAFLADGLQLEEDRRYFRVAFFTGLRPGEQIGLRWEDVDWTRKALAIRRSVSRFGEGGTKTASSAREVDMLAPVERALRAQRPAAELRSAYVFPNRDGGHRDITNLRERVWKPALRRAGLRYRAMYQTRHTFATLSLARSEDIGWVAKMLGHTSTEMVIRHYHRFIPNLTRQDGSALSRALSEAGL